MLLYFLSIPFVPLLVVILVFGAFVYQLAVFLFTPDQEWRRWRVILMMALVGYDILVCIFPNENLEFAIDLQYIFRYGLDFAIWSCIPLYFIKVHGLSNFLPHLRWGIPFCFIAPYLIFCVLVTIVNADLKAVRYWTMLIPSFYMLFVFWLLGKSIREIIAEGKLRHLSQSLDELVFSSIAIVPAIFVVISVYLEMGRWWEICCGNVGVVLGWVLILNRDLRLKLIELRLSRHVAVEHQCSFRERCLSYGLTKREIEVAELLCLGLTYREIAEQLYISEHTVDNHVRHIFSKVEVKRKIELLSKLKPEGS